MKKLCCFLLILMVSLTFVGCFSPISRHDSSLAKVEKYEKQIESQQLISSELGAQYVHGADYALSLETNKTPVVEVAKQLTERSVVALPSLTASNQFQVRTMVDNLVSTDEAINAKGRLALLTKDRRLSVAQEKIKALEDKLEAAESRFRDVTQENAAMANRWYTMIKWIKIVIWTVIICIVLRIITVVLPPPYNSIGYIFDYIIGGFYKIVSKLFSAANTAAGVVNSNVKTAFVGVLEGVQNAKNKIYNEDIETSTLGSDTTKSFSYAEVKSLLESQSEKAVDILKQELSVTTSKEDKSLISGTKSENNI